MNNQIWAAGIGSRETTPEGKNLLKQAFFELATLYGIGCRSGGAAGADMACEAGCDLGRGQKQIFLPWEGFMPYPKVLGSPKRFSTEPGVFFIQEAEALRRATAVAEHFHPGFGTMGQGVKKLMIRNSFQILGPACLKQSMSNMVVCWAKPTGPTSVAGGTGQAVRIAEALRIPVFNLWHGEPELEKMRLLAKQLRDEASGITS